MGLSSVVKQTWLTRVGKLALLLIAASLSIFVARVFTEELSKNAALAKYAWDAYNENNFTKARDRADECIDSFVQQARREEEKLKSSPPPPTGKVPDLEKQQIMERGVLNDVATCYFIKGRSLEQLGQREQAKEAYQEAMKFPHGRCWDPKGWFWSPAEAAGDRVAQIQGSK